MIRARLAAVLAIALLCGAPVVRAAGPEHGEQAREAFERARAAFASRRFAAAASMFEESAAHVLHPAPLVNAADAWERAGDFVRSAQACDRILALPDVEPDVRAFAETRLARVLSHVATLELEGPPGTTARVDGAEPAALPVRVRVTPGPHRIEASSRGMPPRELRIVFDPNVVTRRVLTEADVAPPAAPPDPPRERPPSTSPAPPVVTYVAFGSALAALGGGIYFGTATLDARGRWVDTAAVDARADFYRDRALTNVAFGVALVGAVVGTIVWLRHAR